MDPLAIAGIALTLMMGAMLQTAIGFGIALFAVPLLLLQGLELPHAVATLLGAAVVQTGVGTWVHRDRVHRELILPVGAGQVIGVPLGALALLFLTGVGPVWVRLAVSVAILLSLGVWAFWEPDRVESLPVPARVGSGLVSGLLAGMVGMAGPPLVLYALCHDWEKDRFRVFLWSQMLIGAPLVLFTLVWNFGAAVLTYTLVGVCCAPLVWLAFRSATWATRSWDGNVLRRAAIALLGVIAITNVVSAL